MEPENWVGVIAAAIGSAGLSGFATGAVQFGLGVLNLGGGDVDTSTTMGAMVVTMMAALAQAEREIKSERVVDSVAKRRATGGDLGGRRQKFTDGQIKNAAQLIAADKPAAQVARDLGMSTTTLYRRLQGMERADLAGPT
ncbi:recombinase family protein [Clavibacter michiganensis subsp. insidiosus]|uniref:Recombinase family protein n=1 Tax=Clavibacter michiganensis subsp. insidiosus TaxID=33014 RepID=A0A399N3V4_9MICO|nr:recombinase family protein [Clavibacter michiganensis subsp. insidiosus]RIJ34179.1 recombinase family protein [Clavibacter michiganensis subsp. insidiosus]RMC81950.1 recombinase family protein [Clavibacter michiganensis subsp. insidiosus]